MATQNSNDYGWNALGAVIGTLGNSTINKVSLKNPFLNSLSSGVTSEILGDSETLKKYFNNAYKEEYEKKIIFTFPVLCILSVCIFFCFLNTFYLL